MKPKWAVYLLVVSLLGNAVVLGLYAWRPWSHRRSRTYPWVPTYVSQYNPRVVVQSFEPKMRVMEQREGRWTLEFWYQYYQQPPDTVMDRIALDSITSITRQAFELIYQSRRALPQIENAGLRKRMEKCWRQQMGLDD